ncbi:hypothetical protein [Microvirga aerophila]|uniref:Uncharacterized protein n=1 Tax=Microvirga aerophila TaxID=670291 RepID=A0A512BSI8_9HYPH|nr:hypothetical protein [Microvirga aerophila]GEO14958.1 hypothetical protein MAE02_26540 [Microvirga aerophila]
MPLPNPFLLGLEETEELIVERNPLEPRITTVFHRETRLIAGVAPWELAPSLLRQARFQNPSVYAITGYDNLPLGPRNIPGVHLGRTGRPPVRLRQHRNAPPLQDMRAIAVISINDGKGFHMEEAAAMERLLHMAAAEGPYRVVSRAPNDRRLTPGVITRAAHWLEVLRWMLSVGRCDVLEPQDDVAAAWPVDDRRDRPAREEMVLPPGMGWTTELPRDLLTRPDVQRYRLDVDEVSATALVIDGWHILERGSRARANEPGYIQEGLRAKREALLQEGVFRPVRGREGDLWEVARDVSVPSLTNMVRMVLGNNAPAGLWQQVA